jgi:hypothetical protein
MYMQCDSVPATVMQTVYDRGLCLFMFAGEMRLIVGAELIDDSN